ncbi:MAG: hypothetical protein EA355_11885 [Rhodobacteraceae bacterium]|nr:MAG: hypothetical protein EA355_11885 [Paracoccaceae bacterium]
MRAGLMRVVVAVAALCAAAATADDPRHRMGYATPEARARFQLCRAAVFHHLDGAEDPASTVPRPVARTLLDQINFIMAEAMTSERIASVDDAQEVLRLGETFFLGFTRMLAAERERLSDVGRRDAILTECIPVIWTSVRLYIDDLAAWRRDSIPSPAARTPEESRARQDETMRRLMGGE